MKVVTIATRNNLPHVRVLAQSFHLTHPHDEFVAILTDALPTDDARGEEFEVTDPSVLGLADDDFARMAFMYDAHELVAALKPFALSWVLAQGHEVAVYLDATTVVYASLHQAADAARRHGIAVTPQRLSPVPRDGLRPTEAEIQGRGLLNLGFVAVTENGRPWLAFWQARLLTDSAVNLNGQLYLDQRWADWIPTLFDHSVIEDPGLNVGYWNLDERALVFTPDGYRCQGQPLRLLHLEGYDATKPWCLSGDVADLPRVVVSEHPALVSLLASHDARLEAAASDDDVPYRFASFGDGAPITPQIRRLYRRDLIAATSAQANLPRPEPPVPDVHDGFANIAAWLCEPSPVMPRLTRLAHTIWDSRVDLQGTFPHPQTASRDAYASWLSTYGVDEGYVDADWAVAIRPVDVAARTLVLEAGCHVFGYFSSVLGVGVTGRHAVKALEQAGVPVDIHASNQTQSPKTIRFDETRSTVRYPINVVAMNADMFPLWVDQWGAEYAPDAHTVGLWAWEMEDLPARMHGAFSHVDEIWALSEFNAATFRKATDLPVHVFPVPATATERQAWPGVPGVDQERGYFLFVFDYLSEVERKNPQGLITAYLRAFPAGDGPALVIKSLNGDQRRTEREMVRRAAAASTRIHLLETYLPAPHLDALVQHAVAFVSLHRSEGFGLGLLEAMAQGTPAIATGYSGNLTFMNDDNSILLPYRLTPALASAGYYAGLGEWADPDLDAAAEALLRLADDRAFAIDLGRQAQRDVLARFSTERAAGFARGRVDAIMAQLKQPEPSPPSQRQRIARRLRRLVGR